MKKLNFKWTKECHKKLNLAYRLSYYLIILHEYQLLSVSTKEMKSILELGLQSKKKIRKF